jgi:catechol 2,3-dioxygenase-like lactoylglutathione lyase family enzyme
MIDHISIGVRDLPAMARFYGHVLTALGYAKLQEQPGRVGFGKRYSEFGSIIGPRWCRMAIAVCMLRYALPAPMRWTPFTTQP